MAKIKKLKKIVWSIDPFQPLESHQLIVQKLKAMTEASGALIFPVFSLNPGQLNLNLEFNATWIREYRPAAEKSLQAVLKHYDMKGLQKGKVVIEYRPSISASVDALVKESQRLKADMIVGQTHARKGVERFFMGSFAETLLLRSKKVPCFFVNPVNHSAGGIKKVLFTTDFSRKSMVALKTLVEFSNSMDAEITVMHAMPAPLEAVLQSGAYLLGGGWIPVREFMTDEIKTAEKKMKKLVDLFAKHGFKLDSKVIANVPSITEAVLAESKKHDCVAIASQSGPIASVFVGSITRQVLRSSPVPVWILHP